MLKKNSSFSDEQDFPLNDTPKKFNRGLFMGILAALVIAAVGFFAYYFIIANNSFGSKGLKVTILTKKDCPECWDTSILTDALKQRGANISTTTVYYDSSKGKKLVEKYKITKVPTVLISGDLESNAELKTIWDALGTIKDGVFVLNQVIPPYIDVATGNLKGKVGVTFITDQSCKECYDVNLNANALVNLGVMTSDVKTYDVSTAEGQAIVKKYGIKGVPTIVLQGELDEYQALKQIWPLVGEVKEDGAYVITKFNEIGTYKDISTGKVIKITPAATTNTTTTATSTVK